MADTQLLPPRTPTDTLPPPGALGVILTAVAPASLVDDDLDDGSGPFAHESDELVTLDFVDGGYAMVLEPAPANWQSARSFWEPAERSVLVAASS